MTPRRATFVFAAASALMVGNVAFAQQAASDRQNRPNASGQQDQNRQSQRGQGQQGQGQDDQATQAGARGGQGGQAQTDADRQINQVLAEIAKDPDTAADKMFLLTAVLHNQAGVQLAREVLTKTQNNQVKQLAQKMVQQLQQENQELRQTAQALGLQIPQGLAQADAIEVNIVAALPADQVDKAYTAAVMADDASDASTWQSQSQIAQNQQVRQMAQRQLRAQQQRQQDADQVAQGIGMQGGRESAQPAGATIRGGQGAQNAQQGQDPNR